MGIIHHDDVVSWPMGLDEVHLQDECLFVGMNDDKGKMINMGDHGRDFAKLGPQKVLGDPLFEVLGFANIDYPIVLIPHLVDARGIRKKGDAALYFLTKHYFKYTMVAPPAPSVSVAPS